MFTIFDFAWLPVVSYHAYGSLLASPIVDRRFAQKNLKLDASAWCCLNNYDEWKFFGLQAFFVSIMIFKFFNFLLFLYLRIPNITLNWKRLDR